MDKMVPIIFTCASETHAIAYSIMLNISRICWETTYRA